MSAASRHTGPRRARRTGVASTVVIVVGAFAIMGGVAAVNIARVNTVETHASCTVNEREERALAALEKRDPRVYTDCGVFVIADEVWHGHFNSADVYSQLTEGAVVDITAVGWRNGFFSLFPNAISVEVAQ